MKAKEKDIVSIKVEGVYKSFKIPHEKHSSLKSAVFNVFNKRTFSEYKAADGISFEVKKGEFFGIIGRNGCGKSTMLKMMAGIYQPDRGEITIQGRLSPFLELGVGFNPELSARDNVYLNGAILGLTRKEISERFNEIIEFAELEQFVDQKLKNFSSGMQVRLAFAVAIQAHADVILIDEVLAVGDTNFQRKCFSQFRELKKQGRTVVFVSHSMSSIRNFCDRVAVFENGRVEYIGDPEGATIVYESLNLSSNKSKGPTSNNYPKISAVETRGVEKGNTIPHDELLKILIRYNNPGDIRKANFGIGLYNENGTYVFATNTFFDKKTVVLSDQGSVELTIDISALPGGSYTINTVIFDVENINLVYSLLIGSTSFFIKDWCDSGGACVLPHKWGGQ